MPLTNPDAISFYSPNPALQVFSANAPTFTVSISGTVGVGANKTWSGSTTLAQAGSLVRIYANQNTIPGGFNAPPYSAADWLPFPSYGTNDGGYAGLTIGCSVVGNPSVSGDIQTVNVSVSGTSLSVSVTETNPYSGTMTMTTTVLTFKYIAYVFTPAFNP